METIKINDMQTKGVVFIVKYSAAVGTIDETDLEATLNVNFNKQEIWYLENEVGVGGTVSVLITPSKCGRYINIKAVDMKSAVKGEGSIEMTKENMERPQPTEMSIKRAFVAGEMQGEKSKPTSDREKTIIAQCLTKVFCRNMSLITTEPKFVLDAYNYFLGEL